MLDREWAIYKCTEQHIIPKDGDYDNFCERTAIKIIEAHKPVLKARQEAFRNVFGVEAN